MYGAIATFVDLAPIKRAEEEARRLDRLAALGRFTSSVAHEIRNPLAGIGAGVQYLVRSLTLEGPQRENLDFIQNEIRRLDRILQDLFDITHPRGLHMEPAPLETAVRRAVQCVQELAAGRGVALQQEFAPRTPAIPHDADQMEQVFINLVKNAAEAAPAGTSIAVQLAAESVPAGRSTVRTLVATVTDQGPGIDEDTCRTLFEPFFTTKPGGTGLGLYITHDIVKRHGGNLTVHSEPGHGATFRVELPLDSQGGRS